ncbi:hypothetical protein GXW82_42870 [Streptacidiphilus sp. 4-A2]|nr:hypothetical protein [Streptacidiphilus sp. 4-A2]
MVVAAAAVAALLPGGVATAATGPTARPSAFVCDSTNILTATDSDGNLVPTARRAGVKLDDTIHIRNTEDATLPSAYYEFELLAGSSRAGQPTPTIWWRIGNGGWRLMSLHWESRLTTGSYGWESSDLGIGAVAAHGTVNVEVSLSFPTHSVKDSYYDVFLFGGTPCGSYPGIGWFNGGGFQYWPWSGLPGSPA